MKKLKLCLVALATFFLGAQSVSAATEITSGTSYYIQNVGSGLYLCGANSWGTQGSVSVQGEMFTAAGSDGVYTLEDVALSTSDKKFGSGTVLYTDKTGNNWTIEAVGDGSFTIKNDNGYLAQSATAGGHIGFIVEQVASVTDAAKWYFLTKDEAIKKLSAANMNNPIDASFLIGDANFSRNHSNTAWSNTGAGNMSGGSDGNRCAESWRAAFDVNQTLTGIPNGVYELTAQAALTDYANAYDGANYPVLYGNDVEGPFNNMEGTDIGSDMTTLSTSFTAGKYPMSTLTITVTDGTLKIGVKGTRTDTWCIWDNFQLKYWGVDLTAFKDNLAARIEVAKNISGKMNATVSSDLANAISAATNCAETQAAIEEATTTLNNAITAANNSVTVYSNINALITSNATSVATFDADGKAAYDVTAVQTAYDNGDITDGVTEKAALKTAIQTAAKAQTTVGADMTLAISNWDFVDCVNNDFTDWTISAPNGGNCWKNGTSNVEYWIGSAANGQFDYSQEITGLPKGKYKLTAKMWNSTNGEGGATFAATSGVYGMTSAGAYTYGLVTDDIDNGSMKEYSTEDIIVNDGKLTVGVKNSKTMAARWFGVDYIKLTYDGIDLSDYYNAIADLLTTANTINDPQTATAAALATAKSNATGYESITSKDAVAKIQNDLSAAVTASQASVKAYASAADALAGMKTLVDATNVYTADALNTYYTDPKSKYDAGTLTTDEAVALQNPSTETDWHAAITCDNFLLSAWDTNPDFVDAPYYINTWSKEGDTDGSYFQVPFFEYWTNDNKTLGEKVLTATMSDLAPGTYNVTATVRVRLSDAAESDPTGITFQCNNNDAVNVCDGTAFGAKANLFVKTVTAEATVGEDGVLKVKFNVADGNNISWLAFKDVKFEKLSYNLVYDEKTFDYNGSLCYDYEAEVRSGEVYEFNGIYDGQVYGTKVSSVEAGKPYIVLAGDLKVVYKEGATQATSGKNYNGFYGVAGSDATETGLGSSNYIFYQGNLCYADEGFCSKGHGYFVISEIPSGAPAKAEAQGAKALFSLDLDEATGINAINGADANATIYNIAGQRVNNAKSGLFIINGKKVVK